MNVNSTNNRLLIDKTINDIFRSPAAKKLQVNKRLGEVDKTVQDEHVRGQKQRGLFKKGILIDIYA